MFMNNFKVTYSIKNDRKGGLLEEKKIYFETLKEAFTFSKYIFMHNKPDFRLVGRPSIERM